MKLSVTKPISTTLSFCLRHAVGFYLLGLLVNLPSYLYSLSLGADPFGAVSARPWWEENIALTGVEALLGGFVMAVMTRTLQHDRRNENWSILPSLGESFRRLPGVCGTALAFAVITDGGFLLAESLERFSIFVTLAGMVFVVWWAVICSVAVPVAASDERDAFGGVLACLQRSAELTKGSRWRIVAIFLLSALPLIAVAVGAVFVVSGDFAVDGISPLWILLLGAVFNAFFFALPVVVYEALVILKEGPAVQDTAAVFD